MWLCSVHGFFTGATSAYLKDSLLPPHTLEVVFKRPTLSKILSLCSKLLPKKEIQCTNVEICTSNYIPRIWCVSAVDNFSQKQKTLKSALLTAPCGSSSSQIKRPGACGVFSLGSHPGAARGRLRSAKKAGEAKSPVFQGQGRNLPCCWGMDIGISKTMGQLVLGQTNFGVQKELGVGIYFDF